MTTGPSRIRAAFAGLLASLFSSIPTPTRADPVWTGRKRPRRPAPLDKSSTFGVTVKDGKKHAPLGYAFNGRGDLIRTQPKKAALRSMARKARGLA